MQSNSLLLQSSARSPYHRIHIFNKSCLIIMFLGLIVSSRTLTYHYYDDDNSRLSVYSWSIYGFCCSGLPMPWITSLLFIPSRVFSHPFSAFIFSECTISVLSLFVHSRLCICLIHPLKLSLQMFWRIGGSQSNDVHWIHLDFPSGYHLHLMPPEPVTNSACKSFCAWPCTLLYSVLSHFYLISIASVLKVIPFFWHGISILCINTVSNKFI